MVGRVILIFLRLSARTSISDRPPTLPVNIKRIRISLEPVQSIGVMPRDRPTVPIAETVSKSTSVKENGSRAHIVSTAKNKQPT